MWVGGKKVNSRWYTGVCQEGVCHGVWSMLLDQTRELVDCYCRTAAITEEM